jgi:hypothetical protein
MSAFSFLRFSKGTGQARSRSLAQRVKVKPGVEALEDRQLLSTATIAGFVFYDANNNGFFDPGEQPIANSQVILRNAAGVVIGTTTTDNSGHYVFTTDQSVSTAPTTLTEQASFSNSRTDWTQNRQIAQFDPSLGQLTGVDIVNSGSLTSQIKVENLDSAPATITGTVAGDLALTGPGSISLDTVANSVNESFQAGAFDGQIDFAGASGHDFGPKSTTGSKSISLTDAADLAAFTGTGSVTFSEDAHATSMATGAGNLLTQINSTASADVTVVYHYIPSNALKPGNYTVEQPTEPTGFIDGKDSSNGVVLPNSIGTDIIPVVLSNSTPGVGTQVDNMQSLNNNFGELKPASLSGFVYVDLNNNGVKVPGDPGVPGTTITLTGTDDRGIAITLTSLTAADGSYSFTGLRPGSYTITKTPPSGYLDGQETLGSLGGTKGNDQFLVTLNTNDQGTDYNFGELPQPTVSILGNPVTTPDLPLLTKRMFLASTFRQF